ncbi:MAG: transketolase [bacterium]
MDVKQLNEKANNVRKHIINMLTQAGSGHPGGSLSSVDILVGLYFNYMKHNPKEPLWDERDLFILSKGHGCPALYSVLAESGYFDTKELITLRKLGSRLQGHPAGQLREIGIEMSSGSLGHGLSVAVGAAIGIRCRKQNRRVYCLMSDGEQQEGSVWEAAMAAGHFKLDNLCAIIDYNNLQIDGEVENIMGVKPLEDKYKSFRWEVIMVDGHDIKELIESYKKAESTKKKPTIIIANTIKGKGISFMENVVGWHGKTPSQEAANKALNELK